MSSENNQMGSEEEKNDEKPFKKGWKNFTDGIIGGFDKFQKSLEDQFKKNKESWKENKHKADKFFTETKQEWEKKLKEWNADMDRRTIETKEQWETHTRKIDQDIKSWQEKTKDDWKDGVSSIRKGFFKAYFWILILTIPILIIVVVAIALIFNIFN